MSIEVRLIEDDEYDGWVTLATNVFGEDPKPEDNEIFRRRVEMDRTRAAFDGREMVGTTAEFSYQMTVPGSELPVPAAGVTVVTVRPTHRRRGVLTQMMDVQLEAIAEKGEPVAVLWASESAIYGRFGYGVAIPGADYTIDRRHTSLDVDEPVDGRIRLVTADEARDLVPDTYCRATAGIPGSLARREGDWVLYFHDPEHWRDGASAARYAVVERDGGVAGYVRYRQKPDWTDNHPDHTLRVGELHAVDAEAYAALHRYVFSIDLVTKINLSNRRLNEPLAVMLAEPRRMRASISDRIWLRILDVPAALAGRRYSVDGSLVMEVVDDFGGYAGGRFLLEGGPEGASCTPSDRDPDLVISVADLGAAYLGAARIGLLAWTGRVTGDDRAVRLAQSMFSWHLDPWCTVGF